MNHRIVICAQAAVQAAGAPLTIGAHRAAFLEREGPLPPAYNARFYALAKVGILRAVDGRTSHTRFVVAAQSTNDWHVSAPSDHDAVVTTEEDDALVVLRALEFAYAMHGRDVSTREVSDVLRSRKQRIGGGHPNAVRQRLATLARARRRGCVEWHTPPVERRTVHTVTGAPSVRWRPTRRAGSEAAPVVQAPLITASASDALRIVVRTVGDLLQRPVSLLEVRLWMRQHPEHPAVRVLGSVRLSHLLPAVVQHDRRQRLRETDGIITWVRPEGARLVVYDGDRTRSSRAPRRYAVERIGPRSGDALLACRMLDLIGTLEVDDELCDIAVLQRRGARLRSPNLAAFADVRRVALWDTLRAGLDDTVAMIAANRAHYNAVSDARRADTRLLSVTRALIAGHRRVLGWVEQEQATCEDTDQLRDRHTLLSAQLRHLECVERELRIAVTAQQPLLDATGAITATRVGAETAVALADIQPFVQSAVREWDVADTPQTRAALVERCRHFGDAPSARARRLQGEEGPRVRVDRFEALAALYRVLPVVHATIAITNAVELVGRIVRDIPRIIAIRDASRPCALPDGSTVRAHDHDVVWRATVVALGMLGVAPHPEDVALSVRRDAQDRQAVVLAFVLASPETARASIDAMIAAVPIRERGALALAQRRIELGRLMTVIG